MDANLSFDEPIRVAVVGPLDFIKGVQWELNKRSTRKIELFQWRIGEAAWPGQAEALIYFLEHGTQVPITQLKTISPHYALAVFESMTPGQVNALGGLYAWRMLSWEEGRYDKISQIFLEEISKKTHGSNDEKVLSQLKVWLKEQNESPTRIIWTNAPATWKGLRELPIPSTATPIIVGSLDSSSDFKLPLSGKGEWAVLQKAKHGLQFKSLLPQLPVQFFGDPSQLKSGDRLKIFEFTFELAGSVEWTALKSFLRRSGHVVESSTISTGPKTLADSIREMLENGSSGELVIRSDNKTGYVSIQDGFLEEAIVGPVAGLKALFRILSWTTPQTQFDRFDKRVAFPTSLRLSPLDFQKAYDRWKVRLQQVRAVWPPHLLKVSPNVTVYLQKKSWTPKDFLVFSSLCVSERMFEVMNNCPLLDVEIVESLVNLRKEGLVQIQ